MFNFKTKYRLITVAYIFVSNGNNVYLVINLNQHLNTNLLTRATIR